MSETENNVDTSNTEGTDEEVDTSKKNVVDDSPLTLFLNFGLPIIIVGALMVAYYVIAKKKNIRFFCGDLDKFKCLYKKPLVHHSVLIFIYTFVYMLFKSNYGITSFVDAVYTATTVETTVGYGDKTPKNWHAQLVMITQGMVVFFIGLIPTFVNIDSKIHTKVVGIVSFVYLAILFGFAGLFTWMMKNNHFNTIYDDENGVTPPERINYWDGLYFTLMTLTTIGLGDYYPTSDLSKMIVIILQLAFFALSLGGLDFIIDKATKEKAKAY